MLDEKHWKKIDHAKRRYAKTAPTETELLDLVRAFQAADRAHRRAVERYDLVRGLDVWLPEYTDWEGRHYRAEQRRDTAREVLLAACRYAPPPKRRKAKAKR